MDTFPASPMYGCFAGCKPSVIDLSTPAVSWRWRHPSPRGSGGARGGSTFCTMIWNVLHNFATVQITCISWASRWDWGSSKSNFKQMQVQPSARNNDYHSQTMASRLQATAKDHQQNRPKLFAVHMIYKFRCAFRCDSMNSVFYSF